MALPLLEVAPRQGLDWVRRALRVFGRRPLGFTGLLAAFLLAGMLVSALLPWVGQVVALAAVPLLSLGFMIATRATLDDQPMHLGVFVAPLREPAKRRPLLQLCAIYGAAALVVMLLWSLVDGGRFERWQALLASGKATPQEADAVLGDPRLLGGFVVLFGLGGVLSVPFWHAAALVHWGRQGVAQSLFSSTLALWRTRGAFALYLFVWALLSAGVGIVGALLLSLVGGAGAIGLLVVPVGLMFTAAFYVSLYFSFADTFGEPAPS